MEEGRAHAARHDDQENGRVAVQKADCRHAAAGDEDAGRHMPGAGPAVGEQAEDGLDDGGQTRIGEHERAGHAVAQAMGADEKGQDRGERAAVDVADKVAERGEENLFFIHASEGSHGAASFTISLLYGLDAGKEAIKQLLFASAEKDAKF